MKILKTEDITPIAMLPCDSMVVTYVDEMGKVTRLADQQIDHAQVVDRVVIVQTEEEMAGLKAGALGALMGERL